MGRSGFGLGFVLAVLWEGVGAQGFWGVLV